MVPFLRFSAQICAKRIVRVELGFFLAVCPELSEHKIILTQIQVRKNKIYPDMALWLN